MRFLKRILYSLNNSISQPSANPDGELHVTDNLSFAASLLAQNIPVLVVVDDFEKLDLFSKETGIRFPHLCTDPKELDDEFFERVYRRFNNIPWDIIETERCIIRETIVEDVDAFIEIYKDPSITAFMEDLYPRNEEMDYIQKYIENMYHFYEFGIWTVIYKETGEVIGRCGLDLRDGEDAPELGFVISKEMQKKGLATEVCKAVLQYAFCELRVDTVHSFTDPMNLPSIHLLERLGFDKTGTKDIDGNTDLRYTINKG